MWSEACIFHGTHLASFLRPCLLFELLIDSCLFTVDWSHSRFQRHREYFIKAGDKLHRAIFAITYRPNHSDKVHVDSFSNDYDSSFVKCVSLTPWSKYVHMKMIEIQNIEVKLARFILWSSLQWIKLPKSTCFYERNRIIKKNRKKLAAVSFRWKLMQMTQIEAIRFARWRELDLLGISLQVSIRIRTEISSYNNSIKIWINFFRRSNWRWKTPEKADT